MAVATTILTVVSAVASAAVGAVGAMAQANAEAEAAEARARAAEYNRQIQERNREIVAQNKKAILRQTDIAQTDRRRDNRRVLASIRAGFGASGFEMPGSSLDVLEDSAIEGELDVARIGYEGAQRARDYDIQDIGLRDNATLFEMEREASLQKASSARSSGKIAAFGAVLGAGGSLLRRMSSGGKNTNRY